MKKHLRFSGILLTAALAYSQSMFALYAMNDAAPNLEMQSKNKVCHGVIVDSKGQTIIGATVVIKGKQGGALTDFDGKFSINASIGDILEVSYLGYKKYSVEYKGESNLKIVLEEDSKALSEVVVTALGIKRQTKALAYNAQELKGDLISQGKDANFLNGLNGKVAGVTINQSSSGVGSSTKVVMRGAKSIEKSNNALYVVDGVPLLNFTSEQGSGQFNSKGSTDAAADINPDDIENVTVLTGASAAALYGSAAANGAILITTKKGSEGRIKLTYSVTDEWGRPMMLPKFQNRYGNDGSVKSWGYMLPENFDRYDVNRFFETANTQSHNISVSGGTKMNQTFVSAGYVANKGMVPNNRYERLNITARNTTSLLKDKLKIEIGANYVNEYHRNMINQGEYSNPMVAAYLMPRGVTNNEAKQFEKMDPDRNIWIQNWDFGQGDYTLQNPYWQAYRNLRDTKRERYMLSLGSSYEIIKWSEAENWNISGRINYDKTNFRNEDKRYASTPATLDVSKTGYYGQALGYTQQIYADVLSTINKNFALWGDNTLSLNASLGASIQDARMDNQLLEGPLSEKGYPNLFNIFNIDKAAAKTNLMPDGWHDQTQSIFASAELGFNSYLFLTLTGRNDWASQLAKSPKSSFFYPSVGLSGVITEMLPDNIKSSIRPYLGYLKLRAAYASVASPFDRGLTTPTYLPDKDSRTYNAITYYPIGQLYPERTDSYEVGLSSRWFNGMLTFDGSLYRTLTKNQTIFVKVPSESGYSGIYLQTGEVLNQGVELALGLHFGKRDGFFYDTSFTMSANHNEIRSLADNYINPITGKSQSMNILEKQSFGSLKYLLKKGGTLGDVYTDKDFVRDVNGNIFVAEDGTMGVKSFANEDAIKLGSVLPTANYGWTHEIGYKNLSLGWLFTARQGGVVVSMTEAALDHYGVSERSAQVRDNGGMMINNAPVKAENYFTTVGKNRLAQYYTYDATNIRLAEAHISYKLDRKYLYNIADITLSLVGRNLCFLYLKAPFDPESISGTSNYVQGLDYFMMPSQRTMGFNLKLTF